MYRNRNGVNIAGLSILREVDNLLQTVQSPILGFLLTTGCIRRDRGRKNQVSYVFYEID